MQHAQRGFRYSWVATGWVWHMAMLIFANTADVCCGSFWQSQICTRHSTKYCEVDIRRWIGLHKMNYQLVSTLCAVFGTVLATLGDSRVVKEENFFGVSKLVWLGLALFCVWIFGKKNSRYVLRTVVYPFCTYWDCDPIWLICLAGTVGLISWYYQCMNERRRETKYK